jgi:hypothetical protein
MTLKAVPPRSVKGVGGSSVWAIGIGDIKLHIGRGTHLILQNVLYIPEATVCLISIRCLTTDSNVIAHFNNTSCWLSTKSSGMTIARGTLLPQKNLYSLNILLAQAEHVLIVHHTPTLETWHHRLGHANYQSIHDMFNNGHLKGATLPSSIPHTQCDSCILGKQSKTPVPKKQEEGIGHRATRKLEKVWIDLSGPHHVTSYSGFNYAINIVDDYSSFSWTILLKLKSDALINLQNWERAQEVETGLRVGTYRTDNGELKSHDMAKWLASHGTNHQYTAPYTSAHIGRVERLHCTLMAKARTMRIYAGLPAYLWDKFYLTATHLHVKTTTKSLQDKTPWELWYG